MSNQLTATRLFTAIERQRAPHAVLVTGPEGSDASGLARRAAAMYCLGADDAAQLKNCPDYIELGPKVIPVDEIRAMQAELGARSYSGRRAVTLLDAHSMAESAQNALLKTLEEPPANTLLLLAGLEAGLLLTIRSRCAILRLGAEPEEEMRSRMARQGVEPRLAQLGARLSDGAPLLAESLATPAHEAFYSQAADLFFTALTARTPPYPVMAELLGIAVAPPEEGRKATEEKRMTARYCLRIWQSLCRDLLHVRLGLADMLNPEQAARLRETAQRFTIGRIQGIIDSVLSAQVRVLAANPSLTMDALITELHCPADTPGRDR